MEYTTYKSRYKRQGVLPFSDEGHQRYEMFENHTLLVKNTDRALISHLDNCIKKEKENGGQRTVFTPEEFVEIMTPENAYFEHKTQGRIPHKVLVKMIDFALENGFKNEDDLIEVKAVKVEQGTTTSATSIKNLKKS